MISRTTSATLSRNTSGCSDRMICSTASRAAVILWPSAIVVLLRQFLAGTDDHEARGGRTTLSPARLLHHFYRLDRDGRRLTLRTLTLARSLPSNGACESCVPKRTRPGCIRIDPV